MITAQLLKTAGDIPLINQALRRVANFYPENSLVRIKSGHAAGLLWRRHHRYVNGYWLGHYEFAIQEALRRELKPGQRFFDVGANALAGDTAGLGRRSYRSKGEKQCAL